MARHHQQASFSYARVPVAVVWADGDGGAAGGETSVVVAAASVCPVPEDIEKNMTEEEEEEKMEKEKKKKKKVTTMAGRSSDEEDAEKKKKWQLRCCSVRRPGWKWLVFLGAFVVRAIFGGFLANFTTLSVALRQYHGTNEELIGWVGSLALSSRCLWSPVAAAIAVKIGYRSAIFLGIVLASASLLTSSFVADVWWYFATFSTLYGLGMSLASFCAYDYLMSYFQKTFVRGSGLMAIAASIGLMVIAPAMQSLLQSVGLHNTLRAFAGVVLLSGFGVFAFRPSPAERRRMSLVQGPAGPLPQAAVSQAQRQRGLSTSSAASSAAGPIIKPPVHAKKTLKETMADFANILKSPDMWILNGVSVTMCLASTFTYLNMVSFLNSIGLSVTTSAFTLSMMGVGELVGTATSTLLGDRIPLLKMEVLAIVAVVAAAVTAGLAVVTVYPGVLALVIVMGVCRAIYNLMLYPVVIESMGKARKLVACSISSVMCGIGYIPGGIIGGALYDATGSYHSSLFVCIGLYLLMFVLLVWAAYRRRRALRLSHRLADRRGKESEPWADGCADQASEAEDSEEEYLVEMIMTTV